MGVLLGDVILQRTRPILGMDIYAFYDRMKLTILIFAIGAISLLVWDKLAYDKEMERDFYEETGFLWRDIE